MFLFTFIPLKHFQDQYSFPQNYFLTISLFFLGLVCLFLLLGCSLNCSYGDDDCSSNPFISDAGPLARTSSGTLIGKYLKIFDTEVAAFLGIPYAFPPVGEKRFSEPCPLHHWEGILNATTKPKPCMQYSSRNYPWLPSTKPSEDCLYLNVWTPGKCCCGPLEKLPVIVWIYGGGFYSGSSEMDIYDGGILASHNKAVIVSMNYRLGIFGFLKSGTKEAPGNVGLLDQNLALKWVKKNVEYFGGDPNKITIMGESAGSWSVSLHMVSPMSRNLFNTAILESGTAYHPMIVDSPEVAYGKANVYAKLLGCISLNSSIESDLDIMKCIKSKSSEELAKTEDKFTSKLPQYFLPTYEHEGKEDVFFSNVNPLRAIKEGNIAPVNILIGNTKNEATIFLNYILPDFFSLHHEPLLNSAIAKKIIAALFILVPQPSSDEIYQHYFRNSSNASRNELARIIADAFGDFVFNCPTQFFAEKVSNAYFYYFTHRSSNDDKAEWVGVHHFYEIPYVFGEPLRNTTAYTSEDSMFSTNIMNKWVTFAQTG